MQLNLSKISDFANTASCKESTYTARNVWYFSYICVAETCDVVFNTPLTLHSHVPLVDVKLKILHMRQLTLSVSFVAVP